MNRRSTLKALIGGSVAAVAAPLTVGGSTHISKDGQEWGLVWTGWKPSAQTIEFYGQWVATPRVNGKIGSLSLYSAYPGGVGIFSRGDVFNVCIFEHQRAISHKSTDADRDTAREDAYQRLIAAIDGEVEAHSTGDFSHRERLGIHVPYYYGVPVLSILA